MTLAGLTIHHYARNGQPIDIDIWGYLHNDPNYRQVGRWEDTEAGITVSTVWLGINHGYLAFYGGSPAQPIIFETTIFGGPFDQRLTRYSTEAQARKGHERTVAALKAGKTPWFCLLEEGE